MRSPTATRLRTRIIAVAALALVTLPAAAWATFVPLDGFTDGATAINFNGVDAASNVTASVPGGQRSIWLRGDMQYGTPASATVDTANNQLIVDGTYSSITFGYGIQAWPGGPGMGGSIQNAPAHAIGQDWSGYTGIRIPFLESTSWLSVYINNDFSHTHKVTKAGNLDILFGDWARTNVGMFTISIGNFRAGAYRIGPIQFLLPAPANVPEPAGLPLLAGGVALLLVGWEFRRRSSGVRNAPRR